jgi:UDPglucose 6-dehydrogenase
MKIVIIGAGYVGLVSGVGLADVGHEVVCIDVDSEKTRLINSGSSPIYEVGLEELLRKNVSLGRLRATTDLSAAIVGADVSIIAVGTPFDGKEIDLSFIRQAAADIGNVLDSASAYHVVCVKSTVIPGTTERVVGPILEAHSRRQLGVDLGLCMNPEFLAEGSAVADFMAPDRIVIGAIDTRTASIMSDVYKTFSTTDLVVTTPSTAEMCKYTANAFLATVISFSNEIANLCSEVGDIDAIDVLRAVHMDRRLSPIVSQGRVTPGLMSFLFPGTGFGGSCFPKDVKALASFGANIGHPLRILDAVLETNRLQPSVTIELIRDELGELKGKRIAVLGLAFKPGTDDVRETPASVVIKALVSEQAYVVAHDPIAVPSMKYAFPEIGVSRYCTNLQDAITDVDAVVLITAWPEYLPIYEQLRSKSIPVIDGRRFFEKGNYEHYRGIGLNKLQSKTINPSATNNCIKNKKESA